MKANNIRIIAALTWFNVLTSKPVDNIQYAPEGIDNGDFVTIKEAVNNAYKNPFEVTNSVYQEKK